MYHYLRNGNGRRTIPGGGGQGSGPRLSGPGRHGQVLPGRPDALEGVRLLDVAGAQSSERTCRIARRASGVHHAPT